jgi:hypothetical protein
VAGIGKRPDDWAASFRKLKDYLIAYRIPTPALPDLPPAEWPTLQSRMIDAMARLESTMYPHLQPWLKENDRFF